MQSSVGKIYVLEIGYNLGFTFYLENIVLGMVYNLE